MPFRVSTSLLRIAATLAFASLWQNPVAAQAPTLALEYRAPDTCPADTVFIDSVASLVGRVPFVPSAERTLQVAIDLRGRQLVGTLALRGDASGQRELRAPANDCEELMTSLALATSVLLEELEPPSAPVPQGWPDLIVLTDGTMLRGRIEATEGATVRVTLPSGETRAIEPQTIDYAGPAAGAPAAVPIASHTLVGSGLPIRFDSNLPRLRIERRVGVMDSDIRGMGEVERFEPVCDTPCERTLEPSTYHFRVSAEGRPISGEGVEVDIGEPSNVRFDVDDQSDTRTTGIVLGIGSTLGTLAWLIAAIMIVPDDPSGLDLGLLGGSALLLTGTSLAAQVLFNATDEVSVNRSPLGEAP